MRLRLFHPPLVCVLLALGAPFLSAQISLSITVGPPPIPVYEQPPCPDNGYTWAPGYWAWGQDGYFWVPGTWVQIPDVGMLWTPGYWGWGGDGMVFHPGYWGPHVGFYGGVNYGYGYGGEGYEGGHWQGSNYYYNRAVTNLGSTHVTNVYNQTVVVNNTRVSYNGGQGGLNTAPSARDRAAEQDHHVPPTAEQTRQHESASQNKQLLASVNRGKPAVAATVRAGDFSAGHAVPAKAAGGQVAEAALKATPKAMPPQAKGMPAPQQPQHPAQNPPQAKAPQAPPSLAPHPLQLPPQQHPQPAAPPMPQARAPQPPQHQQPAPAARAPQPPEHAAAPPEHRPAAVAHPQPHKQEEPHP